MNTPATEIPQRHDGGPVKLDKDRREADQAVVAQGRDQYAADSSGVKRHLQHHDDEIKTPVDEYRGDKDKNKRIWHKQSEHLVREKLEKQRIMDG